MAEMPHPLPAAGREPQPEPPGGSFTFLPAQTFIPRVRTNFVIRKVITFGETPNLWLLNKQKTRLSGELIAHLDLQHRSILTKFIDFLHFTFINCSYLLVGVSLLINVFLLAIQFLL